MFIELDTETCHLYETTNNIAVTFHNSLEAITFIMNFTSLLLYRSNSRNNLYKLIENEEQQRITEDNVVISFDEITLLAPQINST